MIRQGPQSGDLKNSPDTIPATAFDQVNYACTTITDQLLHIVIHFAGALDEERLRDALVVSLLYCPVLGSQFKETEHPYWDRVPIPDLLEFLKVHETTNQESELIKVLVHPIDATLGPQIRVDVIRSKTDILCITLHHAAADARGLIDYTRLVANLYRKMCTPDQVFSGKVEEDRSIVPYLSLFSQDELEEARTHIPVITEPWVFPIQSFECNNRSFAFRTLSPDCLARVKANGKKHGATVNEVLLAALALALRKFQTPQSPKTLTLLHSLDLRRHFPSTREGAAGCDEMYDISNRSAPFELFIPIDDNQTLDSLVPLVTAAMHQYKNNDNALFSAIEIEMRAKEGFTAVKSHMQSIREINVPFRGTMPFFVNMGIISENTLDFGPDLPVNNLFVTAGIATVPPGIVVSVSTFAGKMTLSLGFCADAIPQETVSRFLDAIIASLPSAPEQT